MGFLEPTSGDTKSCQLVGWDVSSVEAWRAVSPNTVPAAMDLNMDSLFCCPQLSGGNFAYTRLPHVSHGVFAAGPVQGTYAIPAEPTDSNVAHLKALALAQSRLYGAAPSAVAFVPPPPGRGRSARRAGPAASFHSTPAAPAAIHANLGIVLCQTCVCFLFSRLTFGSLTRVEMRLRIF